MLAPLSSHCVFSYTERFLIIGSLLRRLDLFVNDLRRQCVTIENECIVKVDL